MRRTNALVIGLFMLGFAGQAAAQAPQPQAPTTVQLPTFNFFTVNTTASVPDRGAAYLGGISRGSDSSTTSGLGPLRSRAVSSGRSASTMSVHATIIDHAELDRAVLAEAAAKRGRALLDPVSSEAAFLSAHVGRSADSRRPLPPSTPERRIGNVAEIRRQAAAKAMQRDLEVTAWLEKARSLEAEGKPSVAKVYYQMVARRTTGELQAKATSRIALIESGAQK